MARALSASVDTVHSKCRKTYLVFNYKDLSDKQASFHNDILLHRTNEILQQEKFFSNWLVEPPASDAFGSDAITAISSGLSYWAEHGSFYTCNNCNSIVQVKMPYNFLKKPTVSKRTKCQFVTEPYIVPTMKDIPEELQNLSTQCINALRPFDIDCGVYKRQAHGYRLKTAMINVFPSKKPVGDKIRDLPDRCDRQKCRVACNYLIGSIHSSYSHFLHLREEIVENEDTLNCFDFSVTAGIECALWPNLYPFTSWCESTISGKETRLMLKLFF